MKNKLIYTLILVGGVACHRGSTTQTHQQQYETVQEGSASGVTSTIQGPGETLPPITGTNSDTTTAFALNPNLAGAAPVSAQPTPTAMGTVPRQPMGGVSPFPGTPATAPVTSAPASQLPPTMTSASTSASSSASTPRATPAREVPRPVPPPQQTETVAPPPPQQTDTVAPPPPPQQTDTTATEPPPEHHEQQQNNDDAQNTDTSQQTDTEEPPPPPPPPPAS